MKHKVMSTMISNKIRKLDSQARKNLRFVRAKPCSQMTAPVAALRYMEIFRMEKYPA